MLKLILHHVVIPMKTTFSHAKSSRSSADSLILEVHHKGLLGIGECVPRHYVTGETIDSVIDELKKFDLLSMFQHLDWTSYRSFIDSLGQSSLMSLSPNARCLLDIALFDLAGKFFDMSVSDMVALLLPGEKTSVNTKPMLCKTSQVMDFSLSPDIFLQDRGPFHYIKVKLGTNMDSNVAKLVAIRSVVGDSVKISVDVNMAWGFSDALTHMQALQHFNIDYYEEPLLKSSWEQYALLRQMTGVKILLDESICDMSDAEKAFSHKSCDAFNIRLSKCGGLYNSICLINYANDNNISYQLGAQVAETGPLIAAARQLIFSLSNTTTYEGGQPDRQFVDNFIIDPMPLVDRSTNLVTPLDGNGLGVSLSSNLNNYISRSYGLLGHDMQQEAA